MARWATWPGAGIFGRWTGQPKSSPLGAAEAYALWAATYPPRPHNPLMEAEQAVMAPLLAAISPRRALDVGTGTGRNLSLLHAAGARLVVGLDMSIAMLRRVPPSCGAPCACANALHLPFANGVFDLLSSSLMVGDVEDLDRWASEAARVVRTRGHVVYSDFHPEWSVRGWRRTFRGADGRERELRYFPHSLNDHLDALSRARLNVRTVREPRVGGRPSPVVILFHAVKS
jgi:malonyl-CoA O-methyltransferase